MVTPPQVHNPCGGDPSLDFVNSIGRSPGHSENERLVDYGALLEWSRQAGILQDPLARALSRHAGAHPRDAQAVHERAIALREALFEIFLADTQERTPPAAAVETLNHELARAGSRAAVEGGREGWRWAPPADPTDLDAPLWPIARAAAELLTSQDRTRIKTCASEDCLWLFLDRTRNHGRRWCEMTGCGNREKARRHRRRHRSGGDGPAGLQR